MFIYIYLHINKLKTTLADLSELDDVVEIEIVKTTVYDKLVKKLMLLGLIILITYLRKLAISQVLKKLKSQYLTMLNTLLFKNLIG